MIFFGLSPEQRKARRNWLGGSDAPIYCSGTAEQRLNLYLEKTGDLDIAEDGSWRRYMQQIVETAALDWVEEFGCCSPGGQRVIEPGPVTRRGEQPVSEAWPFIGCTLDGWLDNQGRPVNVKRLSGWTGKKQGQSAVEWAVEHYTVSTIHEALAAGADGGWLLLVVAEQAPVAVWIEADPWFVPQLLVKAREFWRCVETKTPPEDAAALAPPKIALDRMRRLNFRNAADAFECNWSVDFIALAHEFAATEGAHKKHMITRDKIKSLLPEDVGEVDYGRFHVSRTKAQAVRMTLDEEGNDGDA